MIEVSIIIPVHNRYQELERALLSVKKQTFNNYEIIIIDDYSENKISSFLKNKFSNLDIKIIRLSKKCNANVARNKGIKKSKGKYIAFLDSDDEWKNNHLNICLKFIKDNNLDGTYGGIEILRNNESKTITPRFLKNNECFVNYLFNGGICSSPTIFVKSTCAKNIMFDENLERHQDWDFGIRFNKTYRFVPHKCITVIVHWENNTLRKVNINSSKKFIKKHINEISHKNYHKYHRNMYHAAITLKCPNKVIKYYEQHSMYFKDKLNKTDYMSIYNPKTIFTKLYYSIKYWFKIYNKIKKN